MTLKFKVSSMVCEHCARAVTQAIHNLESTAKVTIDLETKIVEIDTQAEPASIQQAITAIGHTSEFNPFQG